MFKKLYSPVVLLSAVSLVPVAQGMNLDEEIAAKREYVNELQRQKHQLKFTNKYEMDLGITSEHKKAFEANVCEVRSQIRALLPLVDKKVEQTERKANLLKEIIQYDLAYYPENYFNGLEEQRDDALCVFYLNEQDELKRKAQEAQDLAEMPFIFSQMFVQEEPKDQNALTQQLFQSLALVEDLQNQEAAVALAQATGEAIKSVKSVGFFQKIAIALADKFYGASNVAHAVTNISLDDLQNSPDIQARVNSMLANHSPSTVRNIDNLNSLKIIYTPTAELDYKFVDSKVNSDVYNSCEKWRQDEEKAFAAERYKDAAEIAELLVAKLQVMTKKQEARNNTIALIEEVQRLAKATGVILLDGEEVPTQQTEPKVVEMLAKLEVLSLQLQAEKLEKEIAEAQVK